jgi:hypothetical protein
MGLRPVVGKPFFFEGTTGSQVVVVSVAHKAGVNQPAFRYAGAALLVNKFDSGGGKMLPGASFTVQAGRKRLSAAAPFLITPPGGEFFFYELVSDGGNLFLQLMGSVLPADPTIAWTIDGV